MTLQPNDTDCINLDLDEATELIISPIQVYNEKLRQAYFAARTKPGLILAGQMLNHLRVIAVHKAVHLILYPNNSYFYNAMKKREANILEAIQLVCPEIKSIWIIKDE